MEWDQKQDKYSEGSSHIFLACTLDEISWKVDIHSTRVYELLSGKTHLASIFEIVNMVKNAR